MYYKKHVSSTPVAIETMILQMGDIIMKKIKTIVFFTLILASTVSQANTEKGINVGGLLGYSNYQGGSSLGTGGNLGFGATAGYNLNPSWELGFEWTFQWTTPSSFSSGATSNLALALVSLDYSLSGILNGLFIGPNAGVGFTNSLGSASQTFAAGVEVGYDYRLGSLSVGPQFNATYLTSPSSTLIQALASIKYHL